MEGKNNESETPGKLMFQGEVISSTPKDNRCEGDRISGSRVEREVADGSCEGSGEVIGCVE